MKGFLRKSTILWCWLSLLVASAQAQTNNFSFIVTPSTNTVVVNGAVSFYITLTNTTGLNLSDVLITNIPSGTEQLLNVTNSQGSIITNSLGLTFDLGTMSALQVARFLLTVQPVNTGLLTNLFQVVTIGATNSVRTNIITQVVSGQADLAVSIKLPVPTVITNDVTYFTLSVTNFGPGTAANVALTNTLPPGFVLLNLYPPNQYAYSNSYNQVFYLGSLASGAFTNITYEMAQTNVGTFQLAASVGAQDLLDANITNNYATAQLVVTNYAAELFVTTNSPATVNYQNGLLEQSVKVVNYSGSNITAVRVLVAGLTNQLFNAVGTNLISVGTNYYAETFVIGNGPLATNQSVQLLLQFAPRGNGTFSLANNQLQAFALFASDLSAPTPTGTSTNLNFTRIVKMASGNMLLEFPTILGKTYTIVYSDNVLFSNAVIAPPVVTAQANEMQWIDYGPPTTTSAPTNTHARFYRVYQNP